MRRGVIAVLAVLALNAASVEHAAAAVVPRVAGIESLAGSPFDFDQIGTHCAASAAVRDTTLSYAGGASLQVHTENDAPCGGPYARGVFEANSTYHLVSGDDFWFGAAVYLPKGFYSAHTSYTDLLRIDSYVSDESTNTPFEDRAEINFASWDNDDLYVRAARGGTATNLIGPISSTALPEGSWNWVEIYVRLNTAKETAYTELLINGNSVDASTAANLFSGAAPLNRLRYGLVSTGVSGSGNLTAYFDRASVSKKERGPTPSSIESRVSHWPFSETGGTTADDSTGTASGTYVNGPALGANGILAGSTAASFDGIDDHVAVSPPVFLNTKAGVSVEAWIKADSLQGSVLRRNNSYELRAQSDGSVLFRVWVGEAVQSLTTAKSTVATGKIYHLVGTYDGATMRVYVNGTQVASQSQTGRMTHGSNTLYLGRNDGSSTYFDGIIDDPAIYSEALSSTTVLELFEHRDLAGEIVSQVSNQSASTDLSGWSIPSLGSFTRSTSDGYSFPASFFLSYSGGVYHPILTTISDSVTNTLITEHTYNFRFRSRTGTGDVTSPTGGCIRLYLVNAKESVHCAFQGDDKKWQQRTVSFMPTVDVESYRAEFTLAPDGFLGFYIGAMYFDDVELVPAS